MYRFLRFFTVFCVGALAYGGIEIAERGYSHITMALLGGVAMTVIHILNDQRREGGSLVLLVLISSYFITGCELLSGEILNKHLGLGIWNYSEMPLNFDGVICAYYTLFWGLLSFVAFILDELIRYRIFAEKPVSLLVRIRRRLRAR